MSQLITRRCVMKRAVQLLSLTAIGAGLGACGNSSSDDANALLCADPDKLDAGAANARSGLGYVEASPNAQQACAGCVFFKQAAGESCGYCEIFNGGPVNPGGHCNSWTAKPA